MRLAALIFLLLLISSCARKTEDDFLVFEEDYFNGLLAFRPTLGTLSGAHVYDDWVEDLSRARIDARIEEVRAQAARLAALREQPLPAEEAIDAEILQGRLAAELFEHTEERDWETNPMYYVSKPAHGVDSLLKREFAPGRERIPAIVTRMRAVPRMIEAMKANVRQPPREFTEVALRMAQGSIGYFRDIVPHWAAFGTVEEREGVAKAALAAQLAMEDAARWLERDLLPRSHGQFALGEHRFLRKLRLDEMIGLPLDQLRQRGEAALARDQSRFRELTGAESIREGMRRLGEDYPRESDLLRATRASLERTRKFVVERQVVSLPRNTLPTVAETPPFARAVSFAAMEAPGAFETRATEAFYYVTPPERDWPWVRRQQHLRLFNRPVLDLISIHEAFPGHYVHALYAERFPTKTRKLGATASTLEGWAHYAEQMMMEEGYGQGDPRLELAQLSEALLRDCRHVASIKMHTEGWTVDRAAAFFEEQAGLEPAIAHEEALRGTYNSTYLYYTMGKLMIYELRRDFQRERGPNYTLRSFHDTFVRQGGIPIPLIRKILLAHPTEAR